MDSNANYVNQNIDVVSDRHVVLDLNGHTINRGLTTATGDGYVIKVEGDLTIMDNSSDKTGTITGGKNTGNGGGVYVQGTFTMGGGTITGNTANQSIGGVLVGGGSFTMTGGKIVNNKASKYGGVDVWANGQFNLSGNVDISGNKAGNNDSNVVLSSEKKITIAGALNVDVHKPIGVSYEEKVTEDSLDFTTAFSTKNPGGDPDSYFKSEQAGYGVFWNKTDTEAMLAKVAVRADFKNKVNGYTYTGEAIEPELVVKDTITDMPLVKGKHYTLEYKDNVNAGPAATVTITYMGSYAGTAKQTFTFGIKQKPITVTADNLTKVQGEDDPALTYKADGLANGDKLSGKLAREAGEEPGTYKIKKGSLDAGRNYAMKFVEGTLTIKEKKADPTTTPMTTPTTTPTTKPSTEPTAKPSTKPTAKPTAKPEVKADYTLLGQLTVSGTSKTALKLTWTKVGEADGYDVFFARCGKDFKLKATVSASESRCVRFTGLKKRECYKAYVRAWQIVNGRKVYIGKKSPELHAITGGYDKDHCNTKSVKLSRTTLSLKVGKSKTIKATLKGVKSGKKPVEHARKVRWYTSNVNVATVDKNGKIRAIGKGTCTVYAVANNGIRNSVKVTVK